MDVCDAIKTRRTVRRFKQEIICRESIIKMIDCARVSPSAGNIQSLKYKIIDSPEERKAIYPYIKYAGYIPDWNPDFAESPMAFIAVLNDKTIRQNNSFTQCDCGIAMMAISLAAVEMKIDSCILGSIDREKIAETIKLTSNYEILYLIGLGISNQLNSQFDSNDSVKYTMDASLNFHVPKRSIKTIIINR